MYNYYTYNYAIIHALVYMYMYMYMYIPLLICRGMGLLYVKLIVHLKWCVFSKFQGITLSVWCNYSITRQPLIFENTCTCIWQSTSLFILLLQYCGHGFSLA